MVVITKVVWEAIIKAVDKPSAYKRKGPRKELRAAVDSAVEEITNHLLGRGARSREQMIKGLNGLIAKKGSDEVATAVLAVLNEFKKLELFSYGEDEDVFTSYVEEILKPMINLTKYA